MKDVMEDVIRKHMIFSGRVQGVGFRYHAQYAAQACGLTGWVRNLYDGTVEMEVQGRREAIGQMIKTLHAGRYIQIDRIDAESLPVEQEEYSFQIRD